MSRANHPIAGCRRSHRAPRSQEKTFSEKTGLTSTWHDGRARCYNVATVSIAGFQSMDITQVANFGQLSFTISSFDAYLSKTGYEQFTANEMS